MMIIVEVPGQTSLGISQEGPPALINTSRSHCEGWRPAGPETRWVTLSMAEWSTSIGRDTDGWKLLCWRQGLCHNMILKWLPCTERIYYRRPYAIKNHRKARNTPHVGGISDEECSTLQHGGIHHPASQHYTIITHHPTTTTISAFLSSV